MNSLELQNVMELRHRNNKLLRNIFLGKIAGVFGVVCVVIHMVTQHGVQIIMDSESLAVINQMIARLGGFGKADLSVQQISILLKTMQDLLLLNEQNS